jgi:hypothetical protein
MPHSVGGQGFVYNPACGRWHDNAPLHPADGGVRRDHGWRGVYWFALAVTLFRSAHGGAVALLALARFGRLVLAAITGALWAVSPMSVTFAVCGMETSVASCDGGCRDRTLCISATAGWRPLLRGG